jgi:endoglucanase
MPEHVEFWKDAATRYKNHPAVLFELFNEPHGITWDVWRNGGEVAKAKKKSTDVNPAENKEKATGPVTVGMQALVNAVRSTGARNMVVAGGLDWAYDLTGVVNGYALEDRTGDGVMYVTHIYPWKGKWQEKALLAADKVPIILTEVGCMPKPMPWQKTTEDPATWAPDMIGAIQKYKLNWTAFSFHPKCAPMVLSDWAYTPTPYWGVYVKDALSGKQFDLKKMR